MPVHRYSRSTDEQPRSIESTIPDELATWQTVTVRLSRVNMASTSIKGEAVAAGEVDAGDPEIPLPGMGPSIDVVLPATVAEAD